MKHDKDAARRRTKTIIHLVESMHVAQVTARNIEQRETALQALSPPPRPTIIRQDAMTYRKPPQIGVWPGGCQ